MMDVNEESGLERLAWVVYDGVLLLGDMLTLSGQHSLDRIHSLFMEGKKAPNTAPHALLGQQTLRGHPEEPDKGMLPLFGLLYKWPPEWHLCTKMGEAPQPC